MNPLKPPRRFRGIIAAIGTFRLIRLPDFVDTTRQARQVGTLCRLRGELGMLGEERNS